MDLPQRKQIRLPDYDYGAPGAYFLTVCTAGRRCVLSRIDAVGEGLAPPAVLLSPIGEIVERELLALPERFPTVEILGYAIMPNHVHLLLFLQDPAFSGGASPSPTGKTDVPSVIRSLKSLTARRCRGLLKEGPLWQRSYYDHVIRNEEDLRQTQAYIEANPARWREDEFYG